MPTNAVIQIHAVGFLTCALPNSVYLPICAFTNRALMFCRQFCNSWIRTWLDSRLDSSSAMSRQQPNNIRAAWRTMISAFLPRSWECRNSKFAKVQSLEDKIPDSQWVFNRRNHLFEQGRWNFAIKRCSFLTWWIEWNSCESEFSQVNLLNTITQFKYLRCVLSTKVQLAVSLCS